MARSAGSRDRSEDLAGEFAFDRHGGRDRSTTTGHCGCSSAKTVTESCRYFAGDVTLGKNDPDGERPARPSGAHSEQADG